MPNENQDQQPKQPEDSQERIKILEEKLQRVSAIAHIQRSELRRAAMRINEMEKVLMVTQNRLDEVASTVIFFIKTFGANNEIKIPHKELENLVPGTVIDDTKQDEDFRYIRIVDVPVQFGPGQQNMPPMPPQVSPEEMGVPPTMNRDGNEPPPSPEAAQLRVVSDTNKPEA